MDQDDPADWSIDRVIRELCHEAAPAWKVGTNLKPIIHPEAVARALRDNDIDGDNLLALDDKDVRNDLNMTSFGQRRAFTSIIEHLRSLSSKYQVQLSRRNVTAWATPQMSYISAGSHARSPSFAGSTVQQTIETSRNGEDTSTLRAREFPSAQEGINPRKRRLEDLGDPVHRSVSAPQQRLENNQPASHKDIVTTSGKAQDRSNTQTQQYVASSMSNVTDQRGPRNAADHDQAFLSTLDTAIDHELDTNENGNAGSQVPQKVNNTTAASNITTKKIPRRVTVVPVTDTTLSASNVEASAGADAINWTPDLVYQHSSNQVANAPNTDHMSGPHAKRSKLTHDSAVAQQPTLSSKAVFPAKPRRRYVRADQLVQPQPRTYSNTSKDVEVDANTEFLIIGSKSSIGSRPRAARQVPPISIHAFKFSLPQENLAMITQAETSANQPQQAGSPEWAQANPDLDLAPELLEILRKHPTMANDYTLPSWGESDEEDRMWTPESESSPSEPDDQSSRNVLNREHLDQIIDQTFEKFKAEWQVRNLPKVQAKAHKKWMMAAKSKVIHSSSIRELEGWRSRIIARIQHLRNGIHLSEWRKAEDVRQQCGAIQLSVDQLEECDHYLEVLRCEHEPTQPPRAALNRSRQPRRHLIMDNGDEELGSESADSFVVSENGDDLFFEAKEMQHCPESPAWDPKFATNRQGSREHSAGTLYQMGGEDTVVDSIERIDTPAASRANTTPDDIMVIDEPDLELSTRKHARSAIKQAAIESAKRNPMSVPYLTDDEEDDSDFERRPSLPQSAYRKYGNVYSGAIDLTSPSPRMRSERQGSFRSDLEIRTPRLSGSNPPPVGVFWHNSNRHSSSRLAGPPQSSNTVRQQAKPQGDYLDVEWVLEKDWDDIEPFHEDEIVDTHLALAKAVYNDLSIRRTQRILDYLNSFRDQTDLVEVIYSGLKAEKDEDNQIEDVDQKNQDNAKGLTHLFVTYATGFRTSDESVITDEQIDKSYGLLEDQILTYQALLKKLLRQHIDYEFTSRKPSIVPSNDFSAATNSSIEPVASSSKSQGPAHKERKRRVIQQQDVLKQQRSDQIRAEKQEARRQELLKQQSALGIAQDKFSLVISASEPLIYLDPRIAARVKPHQVDGIRFMWREIVEDPRSQGCLLAHTMGLGKTLQVISVLASIAQCNASLDPLIRDSIPEHLQRLRVMILCPRGLIDNWFEELSNWLPDPGMLGTVTKLDNLIRQPETTIEGWYTKGGVLIMGYERFRKFLVSPNTALLTPKQLEDRRRHLTEGPDIVIADEAHRLKNAKSKVNEAAHQIVTKSRIAMTGSPLNNYLEEYHTMIEWIAPRYLGSPVEFKAKYVEPINQGLYHESSAWERKASLKRLHVLKRILAPKIHRADITAISKDLPPKTEFFLTITLTDEQKKAYQLYIEELRAASTPKLGNTRLWDWLSLLSLLLNHPSCFLRKIRERENAKAAPLQHNNKGESSDDGDDNIVSAAATQENDAKDQPVLAVAMQKVKDVFAEVRLLYGLEDPSLSHKTLLVKHIIEEAVKMREKTLIFSQSLHTLDYYEGMLEDMGMVYKRIDGTGANAANRQKEVELFNQSATCAVFLISTRAGGLGLNIQSATRVIINDFNFNPTWEEQAIGRAYRMGQTKPVFVYRFLVGGTFEELIHNKAVFKTQLFTRVVDEQNVKSQAAKKPGEFLFDPKEVPQKDFGDCLGKDPNVLDRVLAKVDCVRNIFLTETFFQEDDEDLNEQELQEANEELAMEQLGRENPAEYARRKLEMNQRASQLFHATFNQQVPSTQPHSMQFSSGVSYNPMHVMSFDQAVRSGMNPSSATFSNLPIPSLHMLPQYSNYPGSFGDEYVPSTRYTTQPATLPPRAWDDQIVYDAAPSGTYASFDSNAAYDAARSGASPYFGMANNNLTTNTSTTQNANSNNTTNDRRFIHRQFDGTVDASKGDVANDVTNGSVSEHSVHSDDANDTDNADNAGNAGNADTSKADAPSGCRPQ